MTAKFRMSVKLTRDQRRLLKKLAGIYGVSMTDILVKGIEYVDCARQLQEARGTGEIPAQVATVALELIPLKKG